MWSHSLLTSSPAVLIEVSETSFIEGEPDDVFVLVDNPASKTFNVTVISEDGTAEGEHTCTEYVRQDTPMSLLISRWTGL